MATRRSRVVAPARASAGRPVALVSPDDKDHEVCAAVAPLIREQMLTVWPAFAEAMHFAKRASGGAQVP
jgi:hypothetical protein